MPVCLFFCAKLCSLSVYKDSINLPGSCLLWWNSILRCQYSHFPAHKEAKTEKQLIQILGMTQECCGRETKVHFILFLFETWFHYLALLPDVDRGDLGLDRVPHTSVS